MAPITRRQLFRLDLGALLAGVRHGDHEPPPPVRPPGALPGEAAFTTACDACRKCSEACPHDVIFHLGPDAGDAEGTPFLTPDADPCRWCPTMDCARACPSGALRYTPGQLPPPIASVHLEAGACLNSQGILCDECATVCPRHVRAVTVRFGQLPRIDAEACVGCGLCACHCAAEPRALHVVPLPRGDL